MVTITIAIILEPFVALLMRIRFPRSLASFVVCSFALALLYVIGLGAYSQLVGLYDELPKYGQRIGDHHHVARQVLGVDGEWRKRAVADGKRVGRVAGGAA